MLQPGHHGAEHLHPAAAIATGSFKAEIINANTQFAKLLAGALMPFKHNLADAGQTPAGFADFIQLGAHHLKYSARDETHLFDLITSLKAAILRMTDQDIPRVER